MMSHPCHLWVLSQGRTRVTITPALWLYVDIATLACINGNLCTNLEEEFWVGQQSVAHGWERLGKESCEEACLHQHEGVMVVCLTLECWQHKVLV